MDTVIETGRALFSRRWWWVTLLVIVGVFVQIRLGIWQLDRLEQRRAFNAEVAAKWQQTPLDLNREGLPDDVNALEFRRVALAGDYDFEHQILLKNQTLGTGGSSMLGGAPGAYLVTPLILDGEQAALVVRGWVPLEETEADLVGQHNESAADGIVGFVQESQTMPNGEPVAVPTAPQREWNFLGVEAIQAQMPYELLPFFILQLPEAGRSFTELPLRVEPITLSEGSHFSYAIQWFMFATILGIGYILFVRYSEQRAARIAAAREEEETLDVELPVAHHGAS